MAKTDQTADIQAGNVIRWEHMPLYWFCSAPDSSNARNRLGIVEALRVKSMLCSPSPILCKV